MAYSWLDDPFDERKAVEEREGAGLSGRSKLFVGCGCAVVAAALIVIAVLLVALLALAG